MEITPPEAVDWVRLSDALSADQLFNLHSHPFLKLFVGSDVGDAAYTAKFSGLRPRLRHA